LDGEKKWVEIKVRVAVKHREGGLRESSKGWVVVEKKTMDKGGFFRFGIAGFSMSRALTRSVRVNGCKQEKRVYEPSNHDPIDQRFGRGRGPWLGRGGVTGGFRTGVWRRHGWTVGENGESALKEK